MRRGWFLAIALWKDWIRNREAVFFAFLFPVVLLLIFSAVFGGGAAEFPLYVQNNDLQDAGEPTNLSTAFVGALEDTEALTVRSIDADRNATAWARANGSTGATRILRIPAGFAERVRAGSIRARRAVILDTLNRSGGRANRTAIRAGLVAANATNTTAPAAVTFFAASDDEAAPAVRGVLASVVARFNDEAIGVDEPPLSIRSASLRGRDVSGVDYYLPALIAAVTMINGLITLPALIAEYAASGTLKRLVATPLRRREWIIANVLQQAVLALAVTALMVLVARLVFGVTAVPGPLSIALVLLGTVTFTGFGMALGNFVDGPDAATSFGMAIALPMMFVSGVFWELDLMPEYLQTVARVLPLYHFSRGLRRLMVLETTEGVALPFAILGLGAVVSLIVAVRVTRWQDL